MSSEVARRVSLALGSNLGNRLANLQAALRHLSASVEIDGVSALYESEAVGEPDQQPYFNAVSTGLTALLPGDLLTLAKSIEWTMGRRPGRRWSSRPLDIDILVIEGVTLDTDVLTIPHPRIEERAFVLLPLAELHPDLLLSSGKTAQIAAQQFGQGDMRRIARADWPALSYVGKPGSRPVTG